MQTTEKIKGAKREDLLKLLETRLDLSDAKIVTEPKDDFPDHVKRTMKTVNELRGGRAGMGLGYHHRWHISLTPGLDDLTTEEVIQTGGENFAVSFSAYQFDAYVLLEVRYTEVWRELVTSILSDLPRLEESEKDKTIGQKIDEPIVKEKHPKKPNSQIYDRALIWRALSGWMKLGNVRPKANECLAELKKRPAYKDKKISAKRMQRVLDEGFAGVYDEILKNV
jgi:hypothetical protein